MNPMFEKILLYGLEYAGIYLGEYHGTVIEVSGPSNNFKIKARSSEVWPSNIPDSEIPWARPGYGPGGVGHGIVWTPKVDDPVFLRFHLGKKRVPYYTAVWWGNGESPEGFDIDIRGWKTPAGWSFKIDDENDSIELSNPSGSTKVTIDTDGNLSWENGNGFIRSNANGTLAAGGNDELVSIVQGTLDALASMTIPTAIGPQPPVNLAQFIALQTRIGTIVE